MKNVIISIFIEGGLFTLELDRLQMAAVLEREKPLLCIDLEDCVVTTSDFESGEPGETLTPKWLLLADASEVTKENAYHPYSGEEDSVRSPDVWEHFPY